MQDREKRLRSYVPLWGIWSPGQCLYMGETTAVFELTRTRCDKTLKSIVKMIEIIPADIRELESQFAAAMDEVERMELLSECPYIVRKLDDMVCELHTSDGTLIGYDLLIRMEALTCVADMIRDGEQFSSEEVRHLGCDIVKAMAFAHEHGFVHRDIKPANIYRTQEGNYQLGDFGVSSVHNHTLHTIAGTTAYMAPEIALGRTYDHRADIYSLGVVLYQLLNHNFLPLTGEYSTYSEREDAIRQRHGGTMLPAPPEGDELLQKTVMRACVSDPEQRFPSAQEMLYALSASTPKRGWRAVHPAIVLGLCVMCFFAGLALPFAAQLWKAPLANVNPDFAQAEVYSTQSAYEVVAQYMTWEDAKVYCESRGGHLATITSRQEESEILALLDNAGLKAAWIGANNRNSSKGFYWVTGERFAYAAWGLNEPNNQGGNEYYLMLQQKEGQWTWNDSREDGLSLFPDGKVGFVCEWDGGNAE